MLLEYSDQCDYDVALYPLLQNTPGAAPTVRNYSNALKDLLLSCLHPLAPQRPTPAALVAQILQLNPEIAAQSNGMLPPDDPAARSRAKVAASSRLRCAPKDIYEVGLSIRRSGLRDKCRFRPRMRNHPNPRRHYRRKEAELLMEEELVM